MKVIEFFGMPRSGKTTAIEVMESFLKQNGQRVRLVYEGARISPLDKSDRFNYHSWSFHNTVNRILEAKLDHYDFILVDRGVLDHMAFLGGIKKQCKGKDIQTTFNYYSEFLQLQDRELYFTVNPKEAIKREGKNKPFVGRVFEKSFLQGLLDSYEKVVVHAQDNKRNILKIDGNNDLDYNLNSIIKLSQDLLQEKLKGGEK